MLVIKSVEVSCDLHYDRCSVIHLTGVPVSSHHTYSSMAITVDCSHSIGEVYSSV